MSKRNGKRGDASELLRRSAKEERRLIERERRAERELSEARVSLGEEEARLERARTRVERRRAQVAEAEAWLRERQAARAAGPAPAGAGKREVAPSPTVDGALDQPSAADGPAKSAVKEKRQGKAAAEEVSIAATMGVPNA